ncbi:hypothetical protein FHX74_001259 [Friedmanniella endophytica]|uniref:Uncharacterized protein n=1 Tax=Microlunatus kandeliicorticis TaxID=1759536 RepID=A0A7W3IQZ7_9ACTN|nr:hypothetical protein [Microlunatus kandeliicorticis]
MVLATIGLKYSEPTSDYVDVRGVVGRPVEIGGGQLTVTGVRSGSVVQYDTDDRITTKGLFLVIGVQLDAPGQEAAVTLATVEGDGRTYKPYSSFTLTADAGYRSRADLVVEVDPAHLTGLSVGLSKLEIIHGLQQRALIALPITDPNVEQWRRTSGATVQAEEYQSSQVLS